MYVIIIMWVREKSQTVNEYEKIKKKQKKIKSRKCKKNENKKMQTNGKWAASSRS